MENNEKYITLKFINSTWKKYPLTCDQKLRLYMYKGRFIKFKSKKEVLIEDVRKIDHHDPEFKINGEWVNALDCFKTI